MEGDQQPGVRFLNELQRRLHAVTPEALRPPGWDYPRFARLERIGTASPYQRMLCTVARNAQEEHVQIHELTGLEFGAHVGLPLEHRELHVIEGHAEMLLFEDLTSTFKELGNGTVYIDDDWNVYVVRRGLIGRILSRFF